MSIIDNAKDIAGLIKKMGDIELYRKIVELEAEAIDLTKQLMEKDVKIGQLEDALSLKDTLVCKNSAFWKVDDSGNIVDGPYCSTCWEVDSKACRIISTHLPKGVTGARWGWVQCPKCKVPFSSEPIHSYLRQN